MVNKTQVVLVDEQDEAIGIAEKMVAHQQAQRHRAFSIFIFRREPTLQVLLQKRDTGKYHSGGLWTNACCSHPAPDEILAHAAARRLAEEMGMTVPLEEIGWFHYIADCRNGIIENENDHVFIGFDETSTVSINREEVEDFCWIEMAALRQRLMENPAQFTPWFAQAFELCVAHLSKLS